MKISSLLIIRLACFEIAIFISKYINNLFCFWALVNYLIFRIFILFFRLVFWLSSWQITIFCLLVLIKATYISCTIIVNFLWLIFTFLLIMWSYFELYSSCFLITIVLVIIKISLLSSYLTAITLFLIKLSFILLIFSIIWLMR